MSAVLKAIHSISGEDMLRLQREQYRHDIRNHADIACLARSDRLKHYGLHFAKYVGRLARENGSLRGSERTLVDAFLICLSAANTLHQKLDTCGIVEPAVVGHGNDGFYLFADAVGRFADACEKSDHFEEFLSVARQANIDLLRWLLSSSEAQGFNLQILIRKRRAELADRQFFIAD